MKINIALLATVVRAAPTMPAIPNLNVIVHSFKVEG